MENEKKIWEWLKANSGLNDYAIAGIMGNIQAESDGKPDNLENRANLLLGMTDEEYTADVDSGKYSKTSFARDGGVYGGYGLCQWTYYSRKMELYDYCMAKGVSIGDLESQLEFMLKEMKEHYPAVWNSLLYANSVKAASDVVLMEYEKPVNASSQSGKRAEYGEEILRRNALTSTPSASQSSAASPIQGKPLSGTAFTEAVELIEQALKILKEAGNG